MIPLLKGLTLCLLFGKALCGIHATLGLWRALQVRGGSSNTSFQVRLRLPDGSSKRVHIQPSDSLQDFCNSYITDELSQSNIESAKLEVAGHLQDVRQAQGNATTFAALGLQPGDWITLTAITPTETAPRHSPQTQKTKVPSPSKQKKKLQTLADIEQQRSAMLKLKRGKSWQQVRLRSSTERIVSRIFNSTHNHAFEQGVGLLFAPRRVESKQKASSKGQKQTKEDSVENEKIVRDVVAMFELPSDCQLDDIKKVITLASACQLDCAGLLLPQSPTTVALWSAQDCLTAMSLIQALQLPSTAVVLIVGTSSQEADSRTNKKDTTTKKAKKKRGMQLGTNNIRVEAFQLSNQSFEAIHRGLLQLPSMQSLSLSALRSKIAAASGPTVKLTGKVLVGSDEVDSIDPLLLVVPLPISFHQNEIDLNRRDKTYKTSPFLDFAHDFPTQSELRTSTLREELTRQDFLKKLLARLTNQNKQQHKQGKDMFAESLHRLRDLHLLHYLQTVISASAVTRLAEFVLQKHEERVRLPVEVQLELSMLLQALEASSCDDE